MKELFSPNVVIIHFLAYIILTAIIIPKRGTTRRRGKPLTKHEIEEIEKYADLFDKNLPFTSKFMSFSILILFLSMFLAYTIKGDKLSNWLYRVTENPNSVNMTFPLIFGLMFFLFIFIKREYDYRDKELRKESPYLGIGLYSYVYFASVTLGIFVMLVFNSIL